MRLSVIIPTKDRHVLLAETLQSLASCRPAPDEVVVVDASERPGVQAVVDEAATRAPGIRHVLVTDARGACRQRNRGMEVATGDVFAFLDDDVFLAPDAFGVALRELEDPSVAGVTGHIVEPGSSHMRSKHSPLRRLLPGAGRQGTFTAYGYPNRLWEPERRHEVEVFQGCFMVVRAADAREVGFDERLEAPSGYASLDDEDFCLRLSRRGRLVHEPAIEVEHRNTGLTTTRSRDFNRFLVRNRDYTFRKSFSQTASARAQWWAIMAVHVGHRAARRDWDGVRGLAAGLRDVVRARRAA